LSFKIDWASHIVRSKFTIFALFYFVFEGNFPSTSPRGAYNWRGDLTEGFLRYRIGGFIFGWAYTWRGLLSEFYGIYAVRCLFESRYGLAKIQATNNNTSRYYKPKHLTDFYARFSFRNTGPSLCCTAVLWVVTQRSTPLERCVTTHRTAVKQIILGRADCCLKLCTFCDDNTGQ